MSTTDGTDFPSSESAAPAKGDKREESWREVVREGITMTLYISLSLLAVVLVVPPAADAEAADLALTVLLTSTGLVIAHLLAFAVSSRLVNEGLLDSASLRLLVAQIVGGAAVTVLAVVPILLLGPTTGVEVASGLLLGLVALVGYRAARAAGRSRTHALVSVGILVLLAVAVIAFKGLVH